VERLYQREGRKGRQKGQPSQQENDSQKSASQIQPTQKSKNDKLVWVKLCKDFVTALEEDVIRGNPEDHYRKYPKSPKGFPLQLKDFIKLMHALGFV